jgi:hypothetical protein
MNAKTKTAVAVAAGTALFDPSMDQVPEHLRESMQSNRGSEEVGSKDIVLPRLEIVQSQSPIKDEKPDEAKEGFLFNSATGDVLGDTVYFIPVYYRMEYLVWKDQDEGGGFFGSYETEGQAKQRAAEVVAGGEQPEFIEVVDTPVHYGLLIDPNTGATQQIVISMAKSKSKVSRKWNAAIQIAGGDRFARTYRIGTFKDKNKQNKTFFNYTVMPVGWTPKAAFDEAVKLYEVFKSQAFRANHEMVVENGDEGVTERGDI